MTTVPLLVEAKGLTKTFRARQSLFGRRRDILAVRDVDLSVGGQEAVGVVGESGCGKSTLGRLLLHLLAPTAGTVRFDGQDLAALGSDQRRRLRRRMQLIFQDPFGSLDPRRTVGNQIADGMLIHGLATDAQAREAVGDLLEQVGLEPTHATRLPHEFSGCQRQRIAVARALATQPDFIVADEPVSALDVSIQAQVVNLLADLRQRLGLSLLFISNDLHVVRHLCDRVAVMYLGRVVETGPAAALFEAPAHPYTQALLAATPSLARRRDTGRPPLSGDLPSPSDPPSGCSFRTRCPHANSDCAAAVPPLEPWASDGHRVACWRAAEIA